MGGETVRALDGIDFDIQMGEYVAIIGPSGSGKSTLMNLLGCLDSPTAGTYRLAGLEVGNLGETELAQVRNRQIGFIFQSFHLLPRQTAAENVALPLVYSGEAGSQASAQALLSKVGLEDREDHQPNELSGGQRQRVAIARALVNRPALLLADEPTGNLDTRTSEEILALFDELHQSGATIVLVTHDPETAARAERILHVRDGLIEKDERLRSARREDQLPPPAAPRKRGGVGWLTLFRLAAGSLWGNKLRTVLSVLGVVIGVAAVLIMLSLGEGARRFVEKSIGDLGTDLLIVTPGAVQKKKVRVGTVQTLVLPDAYALTKESPYISGAAPETAGSGQVKYRGRNAYVLISGTTPDFLTVQNRHVREGRFFNEGEVRGARKVCVLGSTIAKTLFGALECVGKRIKIRGKSFEVLGVLKSKGQGGFNNPDNVVVIPVTTAQKKMFGTRSLRVLFLQVRTPEEMNAAKASIERILRRRHRIRFDAKSDFDIRSQDEILEKFSDVTTKLTLFLAAIAAVSLLVGGIGIMNIMLVSVTERTREIGIRKALGATRRDIIEQFLVEATVVSLAGGTAGIAIAWCAAAFAQFLSGLPIAIPTYGYPLAFGFSGAVGVFFGGYPAARAGSLQPIEALRHE